MMMYHMVISVRGMLNWSAAETKKNLRWITKDDGSRFRDAQEFRNNLMEELANGHEKLPMVKECDRHDWKHGCLGHEEVG